VDATEIPSKCPCDDEGHVPNRVRQLWYGGRLKMSAHACDYHLTQFENCPIPKARQTIKQAAQLFGAQPERDPTVGTSRADLLRR
jgi:hypothetical protein